MYNVKLKKVWVVYATDVDGRPLRVVGAFGNEQAAEVASNRPNPWGYSSNPEMVYALVDIHSKEVFLISPIQGNKIIKLGFDLAAEQQALRKSALEKLSDAEKAALGLK